MDPADSNRLPRVRSYSGTQLEGGSFRIQAYHLLWPLFPEDSTKVRILKTGPTTLQGQVPAVWADPRSLAATDGVAFAFFSSGY